MILASHHEMLLIPYVEDTLSPNNKSLVLMSNILAKTKYYITAKKTCLRFQNNNNNNNSCERSLLEIKSFFLHTLFEWSGFFSFFLFFLFFVSWPLFFCFLICAPIVHPQCTPFDNLSIINNILMLFIKKNILPPFFFSFFFFWELNS